MMNNKAECVKQEVAKLPKKTMSEDEQEFVQRYLGSQKKVLGAKTGDVLKIAKDIIKDQDHIEIGGLIKLLDQLFAANTFEEYIVGGKIFTLLKPKIRSLISFDQLEKWLSKARGWVEVDVICQSSYTACEVLERWAEWQKMIKKFSKSEIISLRRASLVLQNPSVRKTSDERLRRLAFQTIDKLKPEKDVLITKAVSWLLRSLVVCDKDEVKTYLLKNETTLPRIAYRETMKKIETGKK